jgi:hypothetical protein
MFHVVTRFGHLYYIPLIPTGSFVVLEKNADGGFSGAEIPLSGKSLLAGWLRGGSVVAMIGAVIGTIITLTDKKAGPFAWALPVVIGVTAAMVLVLTYKLKFFTTASYERAVELARHMGLNDMGILMLEVAYHRMSADQAAAELARREEELAAQQPVQAEVVDPQPGNYLAQ